MYMYVCMYIYTYYQARLEWTRPQNTNQQILVKTSNHGRSPSYYTVSSAGFASFDRVSSSSKLVDRDRLKLSITNRRVDLMYY